MKLNDYNNIDIKKQDNLSSKFQSVKGNNLNFTCNVLNGNFYLDTHNYYPITDEMFPLGTLIICEILAIATPITVEIVGPDGATTILTSAG